MLKMKLENFQNLLKQTKCGSIHLDVPNLLKRKINFRVKIMQKTVKTVQLYKNIFFCENEASSKHFVSDVFVIFK